MGLLSQIVEDNNDVQASEEYVATGSKKITESGNYLAKITMAKVKESAGGALGVDLTLETQDGKNVYETIWVTTKEKVTYYVDREGQKRELIGHAQASGLNYLLDNVWGMPETENKEIKEYNWDSKKEVFVNRDVVTSWIDRPIGISVQVTLEDHYQDKTKPITRVSIAHFFDPVSNLFSSEKRKGETVASLHEAFEKKSETTPVWDKRKLSKGAPVAGGTTEVKAEVTF